MRLRFVHHAVIVRLADGLPDAHGAEVISELFRAVEAYYVCFAVRHTRLADRSEWTGQMAMRAVE